MLIAGHACGDAVRGLKLLQFESLSDWKKYIGKIAEPRQVSLWILSNGQWDIVKHRMAVSKLLRPFAMCSMVKSRMAVSKLLGPFDACSMVKDRMAVSKLLLPFAVCSLVTNRMPVSKFLRPIAAYSMVNNRAQHS